MLPQSHRDILMETALKEAKHQVNQKFNTNEKRYNTVGWQWAALESLLCGRPDVLTPRGC